MIGRVTQSSLARDFLGHVQSLQRRSAEAQNHVQTQRRILAPSDDPGGAARATRLRSEDSDLRALHETVGFGLSVLGAQDGALGEASSLLTRARELAAQEANGLTSPAQRQAAATEVAEIERALITLANSTVGGRHVFGGLATGDAPFVSLDDVAFDANNPYGGPTDAFSVRTGEDGTTTRLTTPGDQVFGDTILALENLRQTLLAGNDPTVEIDALAAAADGLSLERASVGARSRALTDRGQEILGSIQTAREEIGEIEDVDLVEAIMDLQRLQSALEATLVSGQTLQQSIVDYVRL